MDTAKMKHVVDMVSSPCPSFLYYQCIKSTSCYLSYRSNEMIKKMQDTKQSEDQFSKTPTTMTSGRTRTVSGNCMFMSLLTGLKREREAKCSSHSKCMFWFQIHILTIYSTVIT